MLLCEIGSVFSILSECITMYGIRVSVNIRRRLLLQESTLDGENAANDSVVNDAHVRRNGSAAHRAQETPVPRGQHGALSPVSFYIYSAVEQHASFGTKSL